MDTPVQAAAATTRDKIRALAIDVLKVHPEGMHYSQLVKFLAEAGPFNRNTVAGSVWNLHLTSAAVYKPSKGLFRLIEFQDTVSDTEQVKPALLPEPPPRIWEKDFYLAFADWLVNDLEECTKAIPLGGNLFKDKWGTPDVIGKQESKRSDILQAPTEIVSAEIKTDMFQLVTAFGQACAYCLFSHKSYLVVPAESPPDELGRLDSLCQVFGIGLILFDHASPSTPNFDIRVRARKQDPDMFYTNKYLKLIEKELF
jgi:hypothetical protein